MADISIIDSLEHDSVNGTYNSLVQIDSTHFMLAYNGDSGGHIKTFSIDGSFEITEIDDLEHDTTQGIWNSLIMIDSTHFMLAYKGTSNYPYIKTFSIDGSYDNITELDSLSHYPTSYNGYHSIIMLDSTHFVCAWQGNGADGYVKAFTIDGSYNISNLSGNIEHDTSFAYHNSLVKIDSTHFMLAYGYYGEVKTFSISGATITQIDALEHDTDARQNSLIMIDSTHFMLAYGDVVSDGHIKTFSIDGSYEITEIDDLEHDTDCVWNSLTMIDSTHFMLAYGGADDDGYIKTFTIDGSFNITDDGNALEHDTVQGFYNSLIKIDATHFMLAYAGDGDDGYIKTILLSEGNIESIDGVDWGTIDTIDGVDVANMDYIDGVQT